MLRILGYCIAGKERWHRCSVKFTDFLFTNTPHRYNVQYLWIWNWLQRTYIVLSSFWNVCINPTTTTTTTFTTTIYQLPGIEKDKNENIILPFGSNYTSTSVQKLNNLNYIIQHRFICVYAYCSRKLGNLSRVDFLIFLNFYVCVLLKICTIKMD